MWPTEQRIARAKKFLTRGPIRPQSLWVEFGAGFGTYILALLNFIGNGWVVALELESRRVTFLKELVKIQGLFNVLVLRGDFYHSPLRQGFCDGVLLANALHFSSNPQKVLAEACRILRKRGGIIIVEYNVSSPLPWVPYPLPKQKLIKLLEVNAFQDIHLLAEDRRTYSVAAFRH